MNASSVCCCFGWRKKNGGIFVLCFIHYYSSNSWKCWNIFLNYTFISHCLHFFVFMSAAATADISSMYEKKKKKNAILKSLTNTSTISNKSKTKFKYYFEIVSLLLLKYSKHFYRFDYLIIQHEKWWLWSLTANRDFLLLLLLKYPKSSLTNGYEPIAHAIECIGRKCMLSCFLRLGMTTNKSKYAYAHKHRDS